MPAQHWPNSTEAIRGRFADVIDVDVPDRPFILWAFLRRGDTVDELLQILSIDKLKPEYVFRMQGNEIKAIPLTCTSASKGMPRRIRSLRSTVTYYPSDLQPFTSFDLDRRATDDRGYTPLEFELLPTAENRKMIAAMGAEVSAGSQVEWIKNNIEPRLQCWELRRGKDRKWVPREVEDLNYSVSSNREYVFFEEHPDGPLKPGDPSHICVRFRIKKPTPKGRYYAWVLTLNLRKRYADDLIPERYSTDDDSTPEHANRILNLRPMMGTVLDGVCVPGRLYFMTDWR
jgi:hypothetical protein